MWHLHGLLSREGECVDPTASAVTIPHPDVFTDVIGIRTWIDQIVGTGLN
jgi:hypothetical protein